MNDHNCRNCEHAEHTSVWDQYWCTREDSSYYDCRRNGDEYCKAFEAKDETESFDFSEELP